MVVVPNSLSLVGFLFIVSAAIFVPSSMGAAGDNYLYEGQTLKTNQSLVSGSLSMVMQANCNLVIYNDTTELWSTGTAGKGGNCYVTLHKNGNLVLYSSTANQLWQSNSSSTELGVMGYILQLQKNGFAVIYGKSGICYPYWGVPLTCVFRFKQLPLISTEPTILSVGAGAEQRDVLYPEETLKIGESLVSHNARLTMEKDCKLVLYGSNKQIWARDFSYGGFTGCYLKCEEHGNAVIYDRDGRRAWETTYDFPLGNYILRLWSDGWIGIFGPDRWMTHRDGLTRMPSEKTSMVKNE